jgi:hypothetical protein
LYGGPFLRADLGQLVAVGPQPRLNFSVVSRTPSRVR